MDAVPTLEANLVLTLDCGWIWTFRNIYVSLSVWQRHGIWECVLTNACARLKWPILFELSLLEKPTHGYMSFFFSVCSYVVDTMYILFPCANRCSSFADTFMFYITYSCNCSLCIVYFVCKTDAHMGLVIEKTENW